VNVCHSKGGWIISNPRLESTSSSPGEAVGLGLGLIGLGLRVSPCPLCGRGANTGMHLLTACKSTAARAVMKDILLVLGDPATYKVVLAGVVPRNNHRVWVYKAVQCLILPPSMCSTCLAGFLHILRRPSPPKLTIADLFVTLGTKA